MTEYSIEFAEDLARLAALAHAQGESFLDPNRTVTYLSNLSCEIALKALLEKAGKTVSEIRNHSHDCSGLLAEFGQCEIKAEVTKGSLSWLPATRIRAEVVDDRYSGATIGNILSGEQQGASKYPNQIRYGEPFRAYPPDLWAKTATTLVAWAQRHWDGIRVKDCSSTS